ncbi:hypothetical protein [Spirosoma koreense]
MAHAAQHFNLMFSLPISTHVGKHDSDSQFEVLMYSLDMYREYTLNLAEKNIALGDEETYLRCLGTVKTINEMTIRLASTLCLADQFRVGEAVELSA